VSDILDEEEDGFLGQLRDRYGGPSSERATAVADDYLAQNRGFLEALPPVVDVLPDDERQHPPVITRPEQSPISPNPYSREAVPKRMESLVGSVPDPSSALPTAPTGRFRSGTSPSGTVANTARSGAPGGLDPARQRGTAPAAPVPRRAPRTISDYTGPGGEGVVPRGDETSRARRPYSIPEWLRPEERVTPSETRVYSPTRTAMSTTGDDRMQARRAGVDVASRLPTRLPPSRDTEEDQPGFGEAEGSMSFTQAETDAAVAGAGAERERRSGLTLEQLIDEASQGATAPTDAPADNEALELALNRIEAGESEAEDEAAVESVAEDEAEEAAEAEGRELTERERRDAAEDRTLWIQNIIRSGGNFAALLVNAIAGGSPENTQRLTQASQRNRAMFAQELNAVRQSRHRRNQLAQEGEIRTRQADQRDRQLDIQEQGQEARLDISRQDLEMRRLVTEAQAAALGRANEMVPEDELRGWWSALNAQGRTGDQSQDDFAAQQWTRGELAANLNELEQPRGRGGRGARSRRRGPGGAPPGTPPGGDNVPVVDGIPVNEWSDERIHTWNTTMRDHPSRIAFLNFGYRPRGWTTNPDGTPSEPVNPEGLERARQLDPDESRGLAAALSRFEGEVSAATRTNPVTARSTGVMQRAGLPLAGRALNEGGAVLYTPRQGTGMPNPTFNNIQNLQKRITNSRRLDRLEMNVRRAMAQYNQAMANGASSTAVSLATAAGPGIAAGGQRAIARYLDGAGHLSQPTRDAVGALLRAEQALEGTTAVLRELDTWGAVTMGERDVAQEVIGQVREPGLQGGFDPSQVERYYAAVGRMRDEVREGNRLAFTQTPNSWVLDFSGLPGGESHPMNGRQMDLANVRRAVEQYIRRNPNANMSGLSITAAR